MTTNQKQSLINQLALGTGNLVRLLPFGDSAFDQELSRLILTLRAFQDSSRPHITDPDEDPL
jgi:hypothetical protein